MHKVAKGKQAIFPIIGKSPKLINLYDKLSLIKWNLDSHNKTSHVLITGETGVGKENVAQLIGDYYLKRLGKSNKSTFEKFNCAGISEDLAVSLLFGHVKGIATGLNTMEGLINEHAVVVFLDEIQELKGRAAALLLRFMQDGTYKALGDSTERYSSCKIIGATNREDYIKEYSKTGLIQRFTNTIQIPSLNERLEDIQALVEYFHKDYFEIIKGKNDKKAILDHLDPLKQKYLLKRKKAALTHLQKQHVPKWQNTIWTNQNIRTLRKEVINIIDTFMRDGYFKINKINEDYEVQRGAPKKPCPIDYIKCLIKACPKNLRDFKNFWMRNRIDRSITYDALSKAIRTMQNQPIDSTEPEMVEDMIKYFKEEGKMNWLNELRNIMKAFDNKILKKHIKKWNRILDSAPR